MDENEKRLARIAAMSDAEVRRSYLMTDGEPGEPEADALAGEVERRGLDI